MVTPNHIAQSLLDAVNAATDETDRASLIEAIKVLAETEKLNAEAAKFREDTSNAKRMAREDVRRFTITVLAPSISALAVLLALGVQIYQVNKNSTLQREMNEASSLRETLKLAGSTKPSEVYAGALFLTSMLKSPNYGATARSISINLLAHTAEPKSFEALFGALAASTTIENFADLARLSKNLTNGLVDSRRRIEAQRTGKPEFSPQFNIRPEDLERAMNDEVRMVADGIIAFIRRTPRNDGQMLNLADANLSVQKLKNLNLSNSDISGASFEESEVDGADLSNIKAFDDSDWSNVEWWRAKAIGAELLEYLKTTYPFEPSLKYRTPQGFEPSKEEDFQRDLKRLSNANK
jgi:hypothetical protein